MFVVVNFVEDGVCTPLRVVVNDTNCFPNDMVGRQVLFPSFCEFTGEISTLF